MSSRLLLKMSVLGTMQMIEQSPDQIVDEWLLRRVWPWPIALAYCVEPHSRRQAIFSVTEAFTIYTGKLSFFASAAAVQIVYEQHVGVPNAATDWRVMQELEASLIKGARGDYGSLSIPSWGKADPEGVLQPLDPTIWVGGEIHSEETCNIVKEGYRSSDSREGNWSVGQNPIIWSYDIHLSADHVKAAIDETTLGPPLNARDLASPLISRGLSGAPKKGMDEVFVLLKQRIGNHEIAELVSVEAKTIRGMLMKQNDNLAKTGNKLIDVPSAGTIENNIRGLFNAAKNAIHKTPHE